MKRKVGRPQTMGEMLCKKKLCTSNIGASPSKQQPLLINQSVSQTRKVGSCTSQALQQPPSLDATIRPPSDIPSPVTMSLPLNQPGPQLLPSLQPQQPQTQQHPSRNPRVSQTRKANGRTSQALQHPPSVDCTTHPPLHSSSPIASQDNVTLESHDSGPKTSKSSKSKGGRGKSLGIKGWGGVVKRKVKFDEGFHPLDQALKTQLGVMVRNCYRVPLTYLEWEDVPNTIKEDIWKEVKDNVEDCPEEYKSICLDNCRLIWKGNKSRIKADYYTPYMVPHPDPNIYTRGPAFVCPSQWRELVDYWRIPEVELRAQSNSNNRSQHGPLHNTGRTHLAQIRHELAEKGEKPDKMAVFIRSRNQDDPEVKSILEQYNRQLESLGEDERTIQARDDIFHSIVGKDNHGYCRTYGGAIPRSSVYKKDSKQAPTIDPTTITEIVQRIQDQVSQSVDAEIERRVNERVKAQFEQLKAEMFENMDCRGSETYRPVLDAANGHRPVSESVEDDNTALEQSHRTPPLSSMPNNGQVYTTEVFLQNSGIPKVDVAEGLLITMDNTTELDGKPIGEGYCQVLVTKAIKPNAYLERPRRGLQTVADAVGQSFIAWRACDMIEKAIDWL